MLTMVNGQQSEADQARRNIYLGYIKDDPSLWQKGLKLWEELSQQQNDISIELEYIISTYGWIGYCLSKDNKALASKTLDQIFSHAVKISKAFPENGDLHAIIGGLYGMRMGLNPAKAIYLGPRSLNRLKRSRNLFPNSPIPWIENGNAKFHSPPIVGGSNTDAIAAFEKARSIFNKNNSLKKNNWLYLHTLAWLGQAYEKEGQIDKAMNIYKECLDFEPNFGWVKNELLPKMSKL